MLQQYTSENEFKKVSFRKIKKKEIKKRPIDPVLQEVLDKLKSLTPKQIANKSNGMVGANTIANWRRGKVRCPLNYTLEAALSAVGYERRIVRIKK